MVSWMQMSIDETQEAEGAFSQTKEANTYQRISKDSSWLNQRVTK